MNTNDQCISIIRHMSSLQQSTVQLYLPQIAKFWDYIYPAKPFDPQAIDVAAFRACLTTAKVHEYLAMLRNRTPPLGKSGLATARKALVRLACVLSEENVLDESAYWALKNLKAPKAEGGQRPGIRLTPIQSAKVIEASKISGRSEAHCVRNEALHVVALSTGLRCTELSTLRWSDLRQDAQGHLLLDIHGKGSKHRVVKVPQMAATAIDKWRTYHPDPTPSQHIFVNIYHHHTYYLKPLSGWAIWKIVHNTGRRAGIDKVGPHDLRRTFARTAFESGANIESIQADMGHASLATTEKYIKPRTELNRAAADYVADFLGFGSIWANEGTNNG